MFMKASKKFGYLFLMLIASGFVFLKVVLAASLLGQATFGLYTSVLGISGLLSLVISFGQIEATEKLYPRLWASNQSQKMWIDAKQTTLKLSIRFLFCVIAYIGVTKALNIESEYTDLGTVFAIALFTWFVFLQRLVSAIFRAIGSVKLLQKFALTRGVIPLVMVLSVVYLDDWKVIIIVEMIAAGLVLAAGVFMVIGKTPDSDKISSDLKNKVENRQGKSARKLYYANLLSASISLGDRATIIYLLGAIAGGAYGIVALIVQSGALITGILSQKIGPDIIRSVLRSDDGRNTVRYLIFPTVILIVTGIALSLILIAGANFIPQLNDFLNVRGIDTGMILLAGASIIVQIYLIVEFLLIANDSETSVLFASSLALVTCIIGFGLSYYFKMSLHYYILSILVARTLQLAFLLSRASKYFLKGKNKLRPVETSDY